jgi:hypothetical protein
MHSVFAGHQGRALVWSMVDQHARHDSRGLPWPLLKLFEPLQQ